MTQIKQINTDILFIYSPLNKGEVGGGLNSVMLSMKIQIKNSGNLMIMFSEVYK